MEGNSWNGVTRSWQQAGGRAVKLVLALIVVLLIGLLAGGTRTADALSLPGWGKPGREVLPAGARAAKGLQEVAPPPASQQLREALASRNPRIAIETPAAGSLLPDGPWILRLRAEDWPLVDAGSLGLGPHLVVQLDDESPRRLTSTEVTMPPLAAGSHRLTVYAAWPWGEAVKDPGAWRQIRIHRVAANPLSLPAQGSPQLLGVSPSEPTATEPVLVDWLLIDTPLQNLRDDDASWRLRISVNGDSFLVDRQTPLWLKGWRAGSNALQLELVDPRGEPLNPPFNSLVREVRLDADAVRPAWLGARLTASELARLLGEAPPEPEPVQEPVVGEPEATEAPNHEQQEEPDPVPAPPAGDGDTRPTALPPPDPSEARGVAAQEGQEAEVSLETELVQETRETPKIPEIPGTPKGVENDEPEPVRSPDGNGPPPPPQQLRPEGESASADIEPAPARDVEASGAPLDSQPSNLNGDEPVIRSERPGPLAGLRRRLGR